MKAFLQSRLLPFFVLLFTTELSFIGDFLPKSAERSLDLNRGLVMCGQGGAAFDFDITGDGSVAIAPKLDGLGELDFKVSTASEEAQYFFNQGMKLVYGFNHAEALRSFQEAARLDPGCAMAYWGQALSVGPNINDPLPNLERQVQASDAIEKALTHLEGTTDLEKDLIRAYESRCTREEVEQMSLNESYLGAMSPVYDSYRDHPDVATLYAAAIMNTMPWDYYTERKEPKPNTSKCVAALKEVIGHTPNHMGAHHYFIHIIEAADPHQAMPSAAALEHLAPAAGHLVHMPSHIYIVTGHYASAASVNRRAIKADEAYIAQCQAQGLYPLSYYPHNLHFLWAATSMLGRSEEAINTGVKVAMKAPLSMAVEAPFLQDFLAVPFQAYTRFGKWNEILTSPPPGEDFIHTRMMWHYARGMAMVRLGQVDSAEKELMAVQTILKNPVTEELFAAYNNATYHVGTIAQQSLHAEIEYARGDAATAIELLQNAVVAEDNLVYQEPAAWHAPVRHYLGAILLEQGMPEAAEAVYREDLTKNPNNGWALFGLHQSLIHQGKQTEAANVKDQFEDAWQHADVALTSSRF